MKGISLKGRLSKKLLLGGVAVLVLSGGAGGYVLQSGLLSHDEAEDAVPVQSSGVACTTADFIKLNRGGQRWLRKYVRTDNVDGIDRVRTALRVAGVLAQSEKADLYQVVVLDRAGPEGRANLRGAAIGAEVLFAPDPTKLPDMEQPFIARYADGKANAVGLFYGERKALSPDDIRATLTAMTDRADCQTLVADASVPVDGDAAGGHGEPAGHGESAAEGHGAPADGHGAPAEGHDAPEGHGEATEGHGEAAAGHDAPAGAGETGHGAPASGHAESAAENEAGGAHETAASGGWLSTVTAWIPGMGGGTPHAEGTAHEAAEPAEPGMLSRVMQLIPGMGAGTNEAPVENADHAPATPAHDAPEQAVTAPEPGHAGDTAETEGHGETTRAAHASETETHEAADQTAVAPEAGHEAGSPTPEGHDAHPAEASVQGAPAHAENAAEKAGHGEAETHASEPPAHGAAGQAATAPDAGHGAGSSAPEDHDAVSAEAAHAVEPPVHAEPVDKAPEHAVAVPETAHDTSHDADKAAGGGHGADAAHAPVADATKHEAAVPHGVTSEETGATH